MTDSAPQILILAGPNGAGKTTFAREFLPSEAECPTFINADLIAAGLSPFRPEQAAIRAGRLMLQLIAEHSARAESFAFETTLAARNYAKSIPRWRAQGYRVKLYFLALPSPEVALARVAERVRQGGHDIPEETVRRRFASGLANFEHVYKPIVDEWALYDASGAARHSQPRDKPMSTSPPPKKGPRTDPDSALEALKRARKRAEEIAAATGTAIIQWENGAIVRIYPGRKGNGEPEPGSAPE